MKTQPKTIALLATLIAAACPPATPNSIPCNGNRDCPSERVCSEGVCVPGVRDRDASASSDAARLDRSASDQLTADQVTGDAPIQYASSQLYNPALMGLDASHALVVAIDGSGNVFAQLLTVQASSGAIQAGTRHNIAATNLDYLTGALVPIDGTHVLLVRAGHLGDGYAEVLTVNTATGSIVVEDSIIFDSEWGVFMAAAVVDATNFLVLYQSGGDINHARILTFDPDHLTLSANGRTQVDTHGQGNHLARIDATHFLATYNGPAEVGRAVVLTVNLLFGTVTVATPITFDSAAPIWTGGLVPLAGGLFLEVHEVGANLGRAALIRVDSAMAPTVVALRDFEPTFADRLSLRRIDDSHALVSYAGPGATTWATVLGTGTATDSIVFAPPATVVARPTEGQANVALDLHHHLVVSSDQDTTGQAAVLHLPCTLP